MPKIEGVTQYKCDRCKKEENVLPNDPAGDKWETVRRIDSNGNEVTAILCKECADKYRDFVLDQSYEYRKFLAGKE
ncbi:MAG: hypothetical protein SPD80_02830 [Atopobium sp.]|uniref:hypothetical protein n=1 Tax=Atopobium sp. TaxID=1872650 RepID=UPI002A805111|nr:hypothetical protein [Atopobium sp.]MDY4522514.1 hypothetical protein [Atopobium sp.]